jgi:hypothetical protein
MAPFGYPHQASIDRARRYSRGRSGVKSFAVVTSEGGSTAPTSTAAS